MHLKNNKIMKKLLLFLTLVFLMSCDKENNGCWLCSVETRYNNYSQQWTFAGIEKFCDGKPKKNSLKRYDCEEL